jgi:UDP-N-acetylmuramate: L-alanyl-gamma-D-glutamyl-meso-diaminopimelate ligase
MYPTEESYFDEFKKLISSIPSTGVIVANKDNSGVMKVVSKAIFYGKENADYTYHDITQTKNGLSFIISNKGIDYKIESPMIGEFQAENITACFAMAHTTGIEPTKIINAMKTFKGLKRRLEKRYEGKVTVFDDIAHSPAKAKATLDTLRTIYPQNKIIAVFEPNTGNRQIEAIPQYDHAFNAAHSVIIPRLTQIKKNLLEENETMDGKVLAQILQKTHAAVWYIEDDASLVTHIKNTTQKGDVVVFLGSHGFRGMIEELIEQLATNKNH